MPTPTYSDTLTGTAGSDLKAHTSDSGATYTSFTAGSPTNTLMVIGSAGGALVASAAGTTANAQSNFPTPTGIWSRVSTIKRYGTPPANSNQGATCYAIGEVQFYLPRVTRAGGTSDQFQFVRTAGSSGAVITPLVNVSGVAGDVWTLLEFYIPFGSTLIVAVGILKNGASLASYITVDSSPLTPTSSFLGIRGDYGSGAAPSDTNGYELVSVSYSAVTQGSFLDTFVATAGTLIENRSTDSGHTWTKMGGSSTVINPSGESWANGNAAGTAYYVSYTPQANCPIFFDFIFHSDLQEDLGICYCRPNTTSDSCYQIRRSSNGTSSSYFQFLTFASGTPIVNITDATVTMTVGHTYRVTVLQSGTGAFMFLAQDLTAATAPVVLFNGPIVDATYSTGLLELSAMNARNTGISQTGKSVVNPTCGSVMSATVAAKAPSMASSTAGIYPPNAVHTMTSRTRTLPGR